MRLHTLALTAFGPFGTTQEVDFDALSSAGLFLLHGPTGAGKTSVLDAVCYGLYGAVPGARQSPGTSLRSDHAPVDLPTEVRLELTVGGRRLEITRSPAQPRPKRRGGGFTTEKAQSLLREYDAAKGWQALSRSHQEIGEEIGRLVGMSREQFCQVVLLPQGDFARFLRADAEARGKLLGRLFDTRRFAAVEERLAELRRTAEARVRAGDEQILALAQRIAQAAGPAAGEAPLPEDRPGEPGLAEGVLEWAAVARSGAHERSDIERSALAAAESRHAAARHALDSERELARLQQRYEETRRRSAGLEERRSEHDRCHEQLSRARKADLVAPALELRDEAERAHRTASEARERSRTGLPASWPTRAPSSSRTWSGESVRSSAHSTPRAAPNSAAGRSTPNGQGWNGSPAPTTRRSGRRPTGWPDGTASTGTSRSASRRPRRPRPGRNNWPGSWPPRVDAWTRRTGVTRSPCRRRPPEAG